MLTANRYKCATDGCTNPATQLDHIIPTTQGCDPWDRSNWQVLCTTCHRDKTNKERHEAPRTAGEAKAEREGCSSPLI